MRDASGRSREASITKSFANFIDTNGTIVQTLVINEITKLYNSLSSEKKEKWSLCLSRTTIIRSDIIVILLLIIN